MQNIHHCKIIAKQSGKILTVTDSSSTNGALVLLSGKGNGEYSAWDLVPTSDGFYRIVCSGSGKALDIMLGGIENGAWIHQWECLETASQIWTLEEVGDGSYIIKSKLSGKCLDAALKDDLHVQIWEASDGENQRWILQEEQQEAEQTEKTAILPAKQELPAPLHPAPKPKRKPANKKEKTAQAAPSKKTTKKA